MGLVHHTDGERERAYGPRFKVGTFSDALMAEARESALGRGGYEKRLESYLSV